MAFEQHDRKRSKPVTRSAGLSTCMPVGAARYGGDPVRSSDGVPRAWRLALHGAARLTSPCWFGDEPHGTPPCQGGPVCILEGKEVESYIADSVSNRNIRNGRMHEIPKGSPRMIPPRPHPKSEQSSPLRLAVDLNPSHQPCLTHVTQLLRTGWYVDDKVRGTGNQRLSQSRDCDL